MIASRLIDALYDRDSDILYVDYLDVTPSASHSVEVASGIYVRKRPEDQTATGFTVLDWSRRKDAEINAAIGEYSSAEEIRHSIPTE